VHDVTDGVLSSFAVDKQIPHGKMLANHRQTWVEPSEARLRTLSFKIESLGAWSRRVRLLGVDMA